MNGENAELDFPVIDAHVHLYPDFLAKKVTPDLAGRFGNEPSFDGTIDGCVAKNAECGIAISLNLPVATKPESVYRTNRFWSEAVDLRAKDGIRSLASFHPRLEDKQGELAHIASCGFAGIKLHPEYQQFGFNDPSMDEVWSAMSDLGLVAYLHAGGERVFPGPYHSNPAEIASLQRRFPHLTIVAAHLGGFGMWDEAEALLTGTKVHLDLSHTFFWMPKEQILRMIRKHGADRILFGSDAPWQDAGKVLDEFLSLPLGHDEQKAICFDNASRLFRISCVRD